MSAKQAELIVSEEDQALEGEELDSEEVGDLSEGESESESISPLNPWFWKATSTFFSAIRGDSWLFEQEYTVDGRVHNFMVSANPYSGIEIRCEEGGEWKADPFFHRGPVLAGEPAFGSLEAMVIELATYRDREKIIKLWKERPGVDKVKKEKRSGVKKGFSRDLPF